MLGKLHLVVFQNSGRMSLSGWVRRDAYIRFSDLQRLYEIQAAFLDARKLVYGVSENMVRLAPPPSG